MTPATSLAAAIASSASLPQLLVISSDAELLAGLARSAYQAECVVTTAPTLTHGWQMLKDREFDAIAVDCPDVRSGVRETIAILKAQSSARVGLIIGWWDVNAAEMRGLADFVLYKPLGKRQTMATLRRFHTAPFPAAGQRPLRVPTPAR